MAKEFNSIDEWLSHRGTDRRGGDYLRNWKEDGHINVWLHTRRLPISLWQHMFPQLVVFDDRDTGETRKAFWGRSANCHEDETVLKKRYKRDRSTDEREVPPRACPQCKLAEVVRGMVREGKLKWTDEVFVFKGATNADDNQVIHAGGLYGAFSGKLSDDDLDDLKEHGISPREAWRENSLVKENAVFCVVDDDNVEDGVQVATQTGLLGEKVRGVINDEIASKGDEGNPVKNPYCIQWVYNDARNIEFNKKYHARRFDRCKLTPEIEQLIRSEPPDLSAMLEPFSRETFRGFAEKYAVVDLPWDDICAADEEDEPRRRGPGTAKAAPKAPESSPKAEPARGGRRRTKPKVEVPTIPCDECKAPMPEDALKCGKCGAEYEQDDEPAKPAAAHKHADLAPQDAKPSSYDDEIPF